MRILKKLATNPLSMVGLLLLLGFVVVAILSPVIAPPQPGRSSYRIPRDGWTAEPQPPSSQHPFGTAQGQYDIFYGVVWGTRTAFRIGITLVVTASLIGIVVGSVSAYFGGWVDEILMRITDIFLAFPYLVAAMVVTTILGKGLDRMMFALIMFGWMSTARLIRSQILVLKEQTYVEAIRAVGGSHIRVLFRHILPNAIFPVIVQATMAVGFMIVLAATLSFLGLGAEPGYADWGQMISMARNWVVMPPGSPFKYWYTVVFPGAALLLFSLSWNLVGDAFRDIYDPRLRGQ
jgi:peptide/nickel transport system permease protein